MQVHYLVTGGAGFIGLALARALAGRGARVTIVDLPAKAAALPAGSGFGVVTGDLADPATLAGVPADPPVTAVLHLAAQTSGRISHEEPERDLSSNAQGTLQTLRWCQQRDVRRFLYASSMAVYGDPPKLPTPEDVLPRPLSYYGVTKLTGEHFVRAHEQFGLEWTIFRMFNVYGPGQDMANLKQGMASIYLAYVLQGRPVPVTGSLDRFRDFVFIDDVVRAWLLALDLPQAVGQTYNLGSGRGTTVRALLDLIIAAAGADPRTYPVQEVAGHAGDQFGMVADTARVQRDLGWRPQVPLDEGLARMVRAVAPRFAARPAA